MSSYAWLDKMMKFISRTLAITEPVDKKSA